MSRKHRKANQKPQEVKSQEGHKEDTSKFVLQEPKIKIDLTIRDYSFTEKQANFIKIALDKNTKMCQINGIFGSAKTFLAVYCSLVLLKEKKISKILYIRNPLEFTRSGKMGYIPGSIDEKLEPYAQVFRLKMLEFLPKSQVDYLINEQKIECLPIGYIQGRTFQNSAIIIDEAVSLNREELLMALSRMGEHCKMFILGDTFFQNNIGNQSGFQEIFDIFSDQESKDNGIFTFEFKEINDIMRSKFLQFVMHKLRLLEQLKSNTDWSPSKKPNGK